MEYCLHYLSPVGLLRLAAREEGLCRIEFLRDSAPGKDRPHALLGEAARQLDEYFAGQRRTFDLPLCPSGTAFQRQVWQALRAIPYGETRSYAQIAAAVGRPRACRAVGMANHRNPLPIVVPCHRVIGAGGALTGYAGGLEIKKQLLALEQHPGACISCGQCL